MARKAYQVSIKNRTIQKIIRVKQNEWGRFSLSLTCYFTTLVRMKSHFDVEPDKVINEGRKRLLEATRLTGLEIDHVEKECQLYGKDVSAMTNSRLFARFMSRFRFYNPLAEVENSYTKDGKPLPSLDTAWAHGEGYERCRLSL